MFTNIRDMEPRYRPEIDAINSCIASFNGFLNPNHSLPSFDIQTMTDGKNCVKVVHGDWESWRFPHSDQRGVYFIFGSEKTTDRNGIYIGKASFDSAIGNRLHHHLFPTRKSQAFTMKGYGGEEYVLNYLAAINLDVLGLAFMAPSLEEFLISELNKGSLNLINGTGNRKRRVRLASC